jgi:hypothetical protein
VVPDGQHLEAAVALAAEICRSSRPIVMPGKGAVSDSIPARRSVLAGARASHPRASSAATARLTLVFSTWERRQMSRAVIDRTCRDAP